LFSGTKYVILEKMKRFIIFLIIIGGIFVCFGNAQAASLGQQAVFNIDAGYDALARTQTTATLKVVGQFINLYVDDDYWNKLSSIDKDSFIAALQNLANEFDTNIYPKERSVFGSEWTPGIDNDPKITVLILQLINDAGGYINTADEYSKSQSAISNEREMFYLNALFAKEPRAKAFLAHEFQHLITFYQKTKLYNLEEDVWLNEARSEYAPTLCGYDDEYLNSNLSQRVDLLLDNPSDSLTEWKNKLADYGAVSLFIHYLVDHYGQEVLNRMTLNDKIGIESINQALRSINQSKTFSEIFADWVIANYLNNCQIGAEKKYCYFNNNLTYQRLHVDPTASYSGFPNLVISRSSAVVDWAPVWYRFRATESSDLAKDTLKLEFIGSQEAGDYQVPYIITDKNNQTSIGFMALSSQKGELYVPNFISLAKSLIIAPFNQYKKDHFTNTEPARAFSFTAYSVENANLQITSLSPSQGSILGNERVMISGVGFNAQAIVKFGDKTAQVVRVLADNILEVITPAHSAGAVVITVTMPSSGKTASINGYTYTASNTSPQSYPDGSLLRAKGDKKVYVIKGPYKRWIQTAEIFNSYGHLKWLNIIEVDPAVLSKYQEVWLIRQLNDKRVFEVSSSGIKRWLNMTAQQFEAGSRKWDMIFIVNSFERDFYKTGSDLRT